MKVEGFAEHLRQVLWIAAAVTDATPEQREQLRVRVSEDERERFAATGNISRIRAIVKEIMGTSWAPSGNWAEAIDGMKE